MVKLSNNDEQEQPQGDDNIRPVYLPEGTVFKIARMRPKRSNTPPNPEVSKAWRLKQTEEEALAMLERAEVRGLKLMPAGSNYTFMAMLCDPETSKEYAAVYKPMRGEAPLWDFPNGTLYQRECAAYVVCRAFGWSFIPPTIIREGPHGVGTMQLFIDADESRNLYDFRDEHEFEIQRITIFDLITNNADRKPGHFLLGMDGFVWGIDHGLCFNSVPKLRTVVWDYAGMPLPEDIAQDLQELANNQVKAKKLESQLNQMLDPSEVEIFFKRLESLAQNPRFPQLNSRRQVPWGFF
ncbi:SCO1664 family protein [Candidatus Chlorohelix sp.]|uniref:SCO1664 family protein n=1 Tax=Candidatus Chlorohelix sp. TaxID=3139201 RepID=UPI00305E240D